MIFAGALFCGNIRNRIDRAPDTSGCLILALGRVIPVLGCRIPAFDYVGKYKGKPFLTATIWVIVR